MKQRLIFIFCSFLVLSTTSIAQRTITNASLERYRAERLSAEREYRQNYERLGLPSPEEIERRNEQSRIETLELADKLRDNRLERDRLSVERERIAADLESARLQAAAAYYQSLGTDGFYGGGFESGFYGGFGGGFGIGHGFDNRNQNRRRGFRQRSGYYAGGQFWPVEPRTPSRPLIATPRPSRH